MSAEAPPEESDEELPEDDESLEDADPPHLKTNRMMNHRIRKLQDLQPLSLPV